MFLFVGRRTCMIFDKGSTKNLMHMQLDKGYDIIQYCWEKN